MSGRMRFGAVLFPVIACVIAGCGRVDSNVSFVPEKYRQPPSSTPAVDPEPDVKKIVAENLPSVFAGHATNVQVGAPHRDGLHWQACVSATVAGVTGVAMSTHLLLTIESGKIGDRARIGPDHWCFKEQLQPV